MVEGAPLLREYRHKKLIEGSNPSLSARYVIKSITYVLFYNLTYIKTKNKNLFIRVFLPVRYHPKQPKTRQQDSQVTRTAETMKELSVSGA